MRSLLVFLLVQILTNALRQTSCVTPMQTASIPRVLFIALVQLVLLETASTARVSTSNNQSIGEVFSCMDILHMNCMQVYCIFTTYVYSLRIRRSQQHRLRLYLWANLYLFLPTPTQCQFQRPSWRKNISILVCTPLPPGRGILLGMCRWPLRAPTPLKSILLQTIDPILVSFEQM